MSEEKTVRIVCGEDPTLPPIELTETEFEAIKQRIREEGK